MRPGNGAISGDGIHYSNRVGGGHQVSDRVDVVPSDCDRLLRVGVRFSGGSAAVDQGDDSAGHVLVDASESFNLELDAGLFSDLSAETILDGLVQFENAAWGLPATVIAALDQQDLAIGFVEDHGC